MTHTPGYGNGRESARREEGENGRGTLLFLSQQTFISSSANLFLEGTHSCLSFPEQPYLSGKVVTPPSLGEGILIGETDSHNFII